MTCGRGLIVDTAARPSQSTFSDLIQFSRSGGNVCTTREIRAEARRSSGTLKAFRGAPTLPVVFVRPGRATSALLEVPRHMALLDRLRPQPAWKHADPA